MPRKAFESLVLEARAKERATYGAALAQERGPMPGGRPRTEDEQDELWMHMAEQYQDPRAFAMLMIPKAAGGAGLTPLAASYTRYPNRQMLVEGAGSDIEAQTKYANHRRDRILKKGSPPEQVPPEVLSFAQTVMAHYSPTPDNLMASQAEQATPPQQPMPPQAGASQPAQPQPSQMGG